MTPVLSPDVVSRRSPAEYTVERPLAVLADYWALTKPEVNFLIIITTGAGFYLASPPSSLRFWLLLNTLLGTLLVASGTGSLNQWIERQLDGKMRRTARRPLPAGRVNPHYAFWFGVSLCLGGVAYLTIFVNAFSSLIATVTMGTYLLVYTPLKKKHRSVPSSVRSPVQRRH